MLFAKVGGGHGLPREAVEADWADWADWADFYLSMSTSNLEQLDET